MQKIELFGINPSDTLKEIVEKQDLEYMFTCYFRSYFAPVLSAILHYK
ncbi:hypothetical protein HMPREF0083_04677 [Aneurinibacillus aneurinilyticus ATCC 12856]|uniref:Uncharacterized protein n=1 Tax=Aneurinibacillus aneurinilyticus ATCC 12856 TaxID=649747 RepID=U1Y8P6_ANEAE|nr:hypothetical protein HMPREF0083_04677 [Aneurinibacillus aneurinilyticus ATCC 12856]